MNFGTCPECGVCFRLLPTGRLPKHTRQPTLGRGRVVARIPCRGSDHACAESQRDTRMEVQ